MIRALNTAATGMMAQQDHLDVVSHNIANASTTGFKKSRAEFEDLIYHNLKNPGEASGLNSITPTGVQIGLGVRTASVQKDMEMGPAIVTKNPLDLQIEGNGFFQLRTPDGQLVYTRDGQFKRDPTGRIVDKNGNSLEPEIVIPSEATGVEITPQGEVRIVTSESFQPQTIGQIDVVTFVNPAGLKALGKNLFAQSASSGNPTVNRPGMNGAGALAQGQIEGSNVNIVEEMIQMIRAQRAYETNAKSVQTADQMLQTINNLR
ncbi:MAG: flagellar basal-body rod protein FlgG [Bdellovibrionaceae bacterium]|nr:flagellar basal-body rod protein FlgG [Pseudobdellovibrionaceae bacterium]MDW8190649.1 flagellar basal-body rod protein FlgG [Pseudobdellovibrionaceae bacterium]